MKRTVITKYLFLSLLAASALVTSCSNNSEIGNTLIGNKIDIVTVDNFKLSDTKNVENTRVQSRTIVQLLGAINAGEYGNFYSDFVTQFMPSSQIDTTGVIVDNLTLRMSISKKGGYVGDSIAPMGLTVYELTRNLQYPIYSDFGSQVANYYDPSRPIGSKIYTMTTAGLNDTLKALSYVDIEIPLGKQLGERLFNLYKKDQNNYLIPSLFAKEFHGLYVRSTYGQGRVAKIGATVMYLDYHVNTKNDAGRDTTIYSQGTYYAVSPEIITNNNISYAMSQNLRQRSVKGEKLLVAPTGLDIEFRFPINDILSAYKTGGNNMAVVNSLTFTLPADTIGNNYGITPPAKVLMVRSDKKDYFFANNLIPDNITSFLGTYNSTKACYEFPDMRSWLSDRLKNGPASPDESLYTITPVTVNVETNQTSSYYGTTTTTISSVVPYVENPSMVRISPQDAKISLSYSKQSIK